MIRIKSPGILSLSKRILSNGHNTPSNVIINSSVLSNIIQPIKSSSSIVNVSTSSSFHSFSNSSSSLFSFIHQQKRYQSTNTKSTKTPNEDINETNTSSTVNRPRAVGHTSMGKKYSTTTLIIVIGGTVLCLGYIGYLNDFSLQKLNDNIQNMTNNIVERSTGDPLPEDLQRALPTPPPGYLSLILSVEDVLVHRSYHRKYGWVYEPREGIKDLLRSLVDPNVPVFVTLWSENGGAVAAEIMDKLSQEIGGAPAHAQPVSIL